MELLVFNVNIIPLCLNIFRFKRERKIHVQGCSLSQMEMIRVIMKCPEVYINLFFLILPCHYNCVAVEQIKNNSNNKVYYITDEAQVGILSGDIQKKLELA